MITGLAARIIDETCRLIAVFLSVLFSNIWKYTHIKIWFYHDFITDNRVIYNSPENKQGQIWHSKNQSVLRRLSSLLFGYHGVKWWLERYQESNRYINYMTGVINDPLGQPTVPAGSDCGWILKFWNGRTTDTLSENSDHYRSGMWSASWINNAVLNE